MGHLPSLVCVLTCKQMGMQPCLTQTSLLIENFPCDLEAEVGNGRYSAQPQSLLMWVSGQATTYSQALLKRWGQEADFREVSGLQSFMLPDRSELGL